MSAASPAILIEETREQASVSASLSRLYFRRRLFQAIARDATLFACALAALCAVAFVDYKWSCPRPLRVALLSLVLLGSLLFLAHAIRHLLRRRTLVEIAREIERATRSSRNALVTMAEGLENAEKSVSKLYMFTRLETQARVELSKIDERVVAPPEGAIRGAGALAFTLFLMLVLRLAAPTAFAREAKRVLWLKSDDAFSERLASNGAANGSDELAAVVTIEELRVRVQPPAYSGLSAQEVSGDAPVRALAGSQVEVFLNASGPVEGASLAFNGAVNSMRSLGAGQFSGTFIASQSGAFETRVQADERIAPAPLVRAVEVYNDVAPQARITEPASDQLLRSLPAAPVTVRWTASDDLGLANVSLKYIKSRGEGDSAKFTNGEVNIGSVERGNVREWHGTAALDLVRLDMQPGDTLVFWIEARDHNPSANNTGRSASLAIAISAPELAKLDLSDLMPNEIGRFLLSERQIIMRTEKLHNERARLPQVELKSRANDIAAEQRDFKNSFNDYIHLEGAGEEDEASAGSGSPPSIEEQVRAAEDERTAPHMHGIPEPPAGPSTSVKEMTYAIRAMWDAEDSLTNADTAQALKYERDALARLKRAQAAVRYIPPILPRSKPIDLKRRYAGELAEIKTRLEKLSRRAETKESAPVRAALADAYAALGDLQETLGVPVNARPGAVGRARERARQAADRLVSVESGDHAATIAEAAAQLRVVEVELARTDTGGTSDEFATRISKSLALLTQAASNLFAIAESRTRAGSGDASPLMPTDDARAADYFRRLAGGGR
ncbi:MAG: hypothetical protein QOH63_4046 [Acidobacteriota bacterium]|jgi:hypothetical protein|nr:hypothetical protein [Acidobacteriota bacterium]